MIRLNYFYLACAEDNIRNAEGSGHNHSTATFARQLLRALKEAYAEIDRIEAEATPPPIITPLSHTPLSTRIEYALRSKAKIRSIEELITLGPKKLALLRGIGLTCYNETAAYVNLAHSCHWPTFETAGKLEAWANSKGSSLTLQCP
jgi:hypothetical protein